MKNTRSVLSVRVFGIAVIIAAIVFSAALLFAGCESDDDDGLTFNSIEDFDKWLSKRKENTPDTSYNVKLNVGSLRSSRRDIDIGDILRENYRKYVNLDLSESTAIISGEFYSCGTLTDIILPNNTPDIQAGSFMGCINLISITIPDSVTSIGSSAFKGCNSLTSVTFATGSNIPDANFGNGAFPEGSYGYSGNALKTAYSTGKAGTYTRVVNGETWTKQP